MRRECKMEREQEKYEISRERDIREVKDMKKKRRNCKKGEIAGKEEDIRKRKNEKI